MENLKPCPFCGKQPDMDDGDTLYPTGIYWSDDMDVGRIYFGVEHSKFSNEAQECWAMHCVKIAGGCGAQIWGDTRGEAIENWQRRA